MFTKLFKPSIKATLVKKDGMDMVKLKVVNTNDQLALVILFSIVKQIASRLGIDHRALLNKLLQLDSTINRAEKQAVKRKKYGKKK